MKIITRHPAVVPWLKKIGFDGEVIPHLREEDIQTGETYVGVLPVPLIKKILDAEGEFILISLPDVALGQRGQELTPKDMIAAGACLHRISMIGMEPISGIILPDGWAVEPVWLHPDRTKCINPVEGKRHFRFCECGTAKPWQELEWGAEITASADIFPKYLGKDDQGFDCDTTTNKKCVGLGAYHAEPKWFNEYFNRAIKGSDLKLD